MLNPMRHPGPTVVSVNLMEVEEFQTKPCTLPLPVLVIIGGLVIQEVTGSHGQSLRHPWGRFHPNPSL